MAKFIFIGLLLISMTACGGSASAAISTDKTTSQSSVLSQATLSPNPTLPQLPTNSPTPECADNEGKVIEDEYKGVNVHAQVQILVYLPPCYDTENKSYPTLYLLHGKPYDRYHWISLGIEKEVNSIISQGESNGFIVVMPDIPEPLFSGTDGGPWSYEEELTKGLLPHIESSYKVMTTLESRSIAGISRGGIWSLEIGIQRPDLFGAVVSLSPALGVNYPRPEYDPYYLVKKASTHSKFLLISGETDWAKTETIRFFDFLVEEKVRAQIVVVAGDHEAQTWVSATPQMLTFVTQDW